MAVALVHGLLDLGLNRRMLRQVGEGGKRDPRLARPYRGGLRVEHDQRADIRPPVADHARLPDKRVLLQQRLEVRGRDVLAAGGDDELLLAVDDPQVPIGVQRADIPGVQPPLGIDRLGRLLGILVVALHHVATAHQHLTVLGDTNLDARIGDADGSVLDPRERVVRRADARLGHAPAFPQLDAQGLEELDDLGVDRRRARDGPAQLLEPHLGPDRHPHRACPLGRREQLRRRLLAGLAELDQLPADLNRLQYSVAALLLWVGLDTRHKPGLQLLPHPRHSY